MDAETPIRRGCCWVTTTIAVSWTLMLSVTAVARALFVYISMKIGEDDYGDDVVFEGPRDVIVPVGSVQSFQEVLLLCISSAYTIWMICACILAVGLARGRRNLYIPWLVWSGIMLGMCVFGFVHLIAYMYVIYEYVLEEYIVIGITFITTIPLSFSVFNQFRSLDDCLKIES